MYFFKAQFKITTSKPTPLILIEYFFKGSRLKLKKSAVYDESFAIFHNLFWLKVN